jgi:phage terminase small subunit
MKEPALTAKQDQFCREYLIDLNATQAAIRAGYSAKTAMEQGWQLLQKTSVQARIQVLMNERSKRAEINADTILRELLRIATVDLAGAYSQTGELLNIHAMPEDVRRAIAGVEVLEEFEGSGQFRVKVGDTKKVNDKVEHEHKLKLEHLVAGSFDTTKKEKAG